MPEEIPTVDELKTKDLSSAVIAEARRAKKTWFIIRLGDDMIFPVEEKEAWDILNNRSNWKRHDFKFIGCSDGTTYQRIAAEGLATADRLAPEIQAVQQELARYVQLQDRLMLEEIIDMEGDPSDVQNEENKKKVQRLKTIIDRLQAKLEALETEHRGATAGIVKRATDAELEVAKANWAVKKEWPRTDMNIFTPNATAQERARILPSVGG